MPFITSTANLTGNPDYFVDRYFSAVTITVLLHRRTGDDHE